MVNSRAQQSREQQREIRAHSARIRRKNISTEQRQQELSRRRANYRQARDKGKQVETTIAPTIEPIMPFQALTNLNFASSRIQGTHDNESGPSTWRINRIISGTQTNEAEPTIRNIDDTNSESPTPIVLSSASTNDATSNYNQESQRTFQAIHNSGRNFRNNATMIRALLPTPRLCRHCNAKLFYKESQYMCCKKGNVTITEVDPPEELQQLFSDTSTEGRHFRQNIRSYNHVMSFTSLGVHIDESVLATGRGIYTFRAQGAMYHKIGGFHPTQGSRPRYLQLYIYDTENELENRMMENPSLNQVVVYKLQNMLHRCNLFVHKLRQLAIEPNVHNCRLLIKERPSNQPQYNLPSASQVAAIVVGGDDETLQRGRDINVLSNDGNLIRQCKPNSKSLLLNV